MSDDYTLNEVSEHDASGNPLDEGGFDEFDAPPNKGTSAGSLGEIWSNNPIVKIVVVLMAVVAVFIGIVMFGGSDDKNISQVGSALQESEAPGQDTSEAYRDAINEVNQQRLEQAIQTGESTIPIPIATPDTQAPQPVNEQPPVTLEDPLEGWRSTNQTVEPEPSLEPTLDPNDMQFPGAGPTTGQQRIVAQAPDPAAVDALAQAMGLQMQNILDKHKITGAHMMQVTTSDYLSKKTQDATNANTASTSVQEIKEILIPAGTIVYAQTMTEANTDAPGPVLARLSSGALTGSRILGTFDNTDNYLTLQFNTVVVNGVSQSVNAVALDPKTTLPAVATEVDRRYWRRVILPAAAKFIEGMGGAIAQREQTITVNNGTVTASQPSLNTREQIAAGLEEGTKVLADELDDEANNTKVMIKVHAGTPIGILFLEPVLKN